MLLKAASLEFLPLAARIGELALQLVDAPVALGQFPPQPLDLVKLLVRKLLKPVRRTDHALQRRAPPMRARVEARTL